LTPLTPFKFYGGLDVQGFPPAPVGDREPVDTGVDVWGRALEDLPRPIGV
jgi:hypothetical protein